MTAGTRRQKAIRKAIRDLAPLIPLADAEIVSDQALAGHLRHLPPTIAASLALTSRLRHAHTDYDALIAEGYDRDSARFFVADAMAEVATRWGARDLIAVAEETEEA